MVFFEEDNTRWGVSAKWATRQHECNLAGIRTRCGGMCCSSPAFWPPRAFRDVTTERFGELIHNGAGLARIGTACGYLTDSGCKFDPKNRPVTCLLYPLMLNKYSTLVGHVRITTSRGLCRGNHNHGPMIIDVLRENLSALFGYDQVMRVRADIVEKHIDSYFIVPDAVVRQYALEQLWERENVKPLPRTEY